MTTILATWAELYRLWQIAPVSEGARVYEPDVGDRFVLDGQRGTILSVLWPSFAKASDWRADPPGDTNETSIVMRLDFGPSAGGCAYLTGDIPKEILETLIDRSCDILKIAHHGSRTGTNKEILEKARPKVAVIQVGKNNRFGHPHQDVLDLLQARGVKILRSDLDGDIDN